MSNKRIVEKLLLSLTRIYDNCLPVIERTKKLDKNDSTEVEETFEVFEQRLIFYFILFLKGDN